MNRHLARIAGPIMTMIVVAVSCGSGGTVTTGSAGAIDQSPTGVAIATPVGASASELDEPDPGPTPVAPTSVPSSAPAAAATPLPVEPVPAADFPTGSTPIRLTIPSIGVDAPTIELSLAGLEPEVPTDFDDTGWYTQTRLPGEIGPAVIAGHIDSRSGPAVFARLDELAPGAEIIVHGVDGEQRTFVVTDAQQYPKGDLPDSVFGFGEPEPELRLITCGGTFDAATGHYRDNYVVFATART